MHGVWTGMGREKQERSMGDLHLSVVCPIAPIRCFFSLFFLPSPATIICRYSMTYDLALCSSSNCNVQYPEVADDRTDAEECVEHSSHVAFFVIGRAWHPGANVHHPTSSLSFSFPPVVWILTPRGNLQGLVHQCSPIPICGPLAIEYDYHYGAGTTGLS